MAAKLNFVIVFSFCFILGGENLFLFTSSFGSSVNVHLVYRLQVSRRQCFDLYYCCDNDGIYVNVNRPIFIFFFGGGVTR